MSDKKQSVCAWCYYARMRTDICGIYCTGGFVNEDGCCDRYLSYDEYKKRKRKKEGEADGRGA